MFWIRWSCVRPKTPSRLSFRVPGDMACGARPCLTSNEPVPAIRKAYGRGWLLLSLLGLLTAGLLILPSCILPVPVLNVAFSQARDLGFEIMSVQEIRPGMRGIGKTVVSGDRVSDFDVEILGVLKDELTGADRILVRVPGVPGSPSPGIAAGMSGSPVYIDGRLIGAISYAYEFADPTIGMVTPIGEMLRALDAERHAEPVALVPRDPLFVNGRWIDCVFLSRGQAGSLPFWSRALPLRWVSSPAGAMVMRPVATPLMVSGASGRGFRELLSKLERFGIFPTPSGTSMPFGGRAGAESSGAAVLLPGSAFGVQLVRGDLTVTAIGTLTARIGDSLLAFGHPFLARGNSSYFATAAYVHAVVPSIAMPFKIASPGALVGTATQDRSYGLLARLGKVIPPVPLKLRIRDEDQKIERSAVYEIVRDEVLIPDLVPACILSSLDALLSRIGPGTSRVRLEVSSKFLPNPIVRENMYYSSRDVSLDSLSEVTEAVSMLMANDLQAPDLVEIKADCKITEKRLTAMIEDVHLDTTQVEPGGKISIEVRLRPFRGREVIEKLTLTIPEDLPPGRVTLGVRGGGVPSIGEMATASVSQDAGAGSPTKEGKSREESFLDLLQEFQQRDRNNEIVAELLLDASGYYEEPQSNGGEGAPSGKGKEPTRPGEKPVVRPGLGMRKATAAGGPKGIDDPADRAPQNAEGKGGDKGKSVPRSPIRSSVLSDYVIEGHREVEVDILEAAEHHEPEAAESKPAESR